MYVFIHRDLWEAYVGENLRQAYCHFRAAYPKLRGMVPADFIIAPCSDFYPKWYVRSSSSVLEIN